MNYIRAKYADFVRWACWNAWDYARKREIARSGDVGIAPIPDSTAELHPEQRRIIGNEAQQLLDSKHFRDAFNAVEAGLEAQVQACDPDNKDKAQRVVLAKQILMAIKREIIRKADDGYMAEVEIVELEKRRGLRRFVR